MKRWITMLLLAFSVLAAWALPTVDQVQAEVAKGNYAAAEVMMRDVLAERPDSARAHYVLAEILAHNGRIDDARQAARRARELDPQIRFTTPQKFAEFEQALARAGQPGAPVAKAERGFTPVPAGDAGRATASPAPAVPVWAWGLGGAVIGLVLWRLLTRRRRAATAAAAATGWRGQAGAHGAAGGRSGMVGAGLAGAGGFAAGMLAERLLRGDDANASGSDGSALDDGGDELSRRSIDFGTGGSDWSSDGGGDGGGGDGGGGGDW